MYKKKPPHTGAGVKVVEAFMSDKSDRAPKAGLRRATAPTDNHRRRGPGGRRRTQEGAAKREYCSWRSYGFDFSCLSFVYCFLFVLPMYYFEESIAYLKILSSIFIHSLYAPFLSLF